MDFDSILDLRPGIKMDILIAELMDYEVDTRNGVDNSRCFVFKGKNVKRQTAELFHPSTNIAAAWEVANKFGIAVIPQSSDEGFAWWACDIESVHYRGFEVVIREKYDSGISASTAAEAICKAALLSKCNNNVQCP